MKVEFVEMGSEEIEKMVDRLIINGDKRVLDSNWIGLMSE